MKSRKITRSQKRKMSSTMTTTTQRWAQKIGRSQKDGLVRHGCDARAKGGTLGQDGVQEIGPGMAKAVGAEDPEMREARGAGRLGQQHVQGAGCRMLNVLTRARRWDQAAEKGRPGRVHGWGAKQQARGVHGRSARQWAGDGEGAWPECSETSQGWAGVWGNDRGRSWALGSRKVHLVLWIHNFTGARSRRKQKMCIGETEGREGVWLKKLDFTVIHDFSLPLTRHRAT